MNILITGSSGFIGSNLYKDFKKNKKNKIFLIDKKKNVYFKAKNFIQVDLKNIQKVENFILKKNINVIIHLAAISGVKYCHQMPKKAFDENIVSSFNILNIAKKLKIKKTLIASSFSINTFSENPSFYSFTKYTVENMVHTFRKNYNLNVSVLRFSNVFGPYSSHKISAVHNFIKNSLKNKDFEIHGTGKQSRDFIYVSDISKKINNIINKKKLKYIYNLNTKKKTSILNIIKAINIISGKKNKVKFVKAPDGYDIRPDSITKKKNTDKRLYNYLQKTYRWYRHL